MSYVVSSNYYIQDASANNSSNNIQIYAYVPYFTSASSLQWKCQWNASGNVDFPYSSWSATITYGVRTENYYGSGGGTQTAYVSTQAILPSSGSFTVTARQTGSTVGNSCTATGRSWTFYITQISANFTFISATNNASSNMVISRLPATGTAVGQIFYICNRGNTNIAAVCSHAGEGIDLSLINNAEYSSLYLPQWACVGLTPNAAGTKWHVISYYAGNMPPTSVFNVNGTTITSPVVISSNAGTSKTVIMPNPSTWGKGNQLYVTTYQTNSGSYGTSGQFAIYTNGFFAQDTTLNKYFSLVPQSDAGGRYDHNMSIFFISDGTSWYIASVFTGAFCTFDSFNNAGNLMTGRIALVGTSPYFVSPPIGPTIDDRAQLYYTKLTTTTPQSYGIIISGNGNSTTRGQMGSITWNRVYKSSSTVNYSALNMLQAKTASPFLINFPLGMYPSQY